VNARLAESLLTFAEEVGPRLRGLDSKAAIEELAQRYEELQSVMEWFIDQERVDEALRTASALMIFWMTTKRINESAKWFDRVLAMNGGDPAHKGRALFDAGYLAFWRGDDERSSLLQHRALEIGRHTNNPTVTALALVGLARIALRTNVDEARRLCREAVAVTEGTDDRIGRSSAMHVLAVAAQMSGDLIEAGDLMRQRIAIGRETGNFATISSEAGNLSMVERQLGHLDEAEALARESLEIDYRRGDAMALPWKVNGLAAVAADRGEIVRAATLIGIADGALAAAHGAWPPDEREQYERTVAILLGSMPPAQFDYARANGRAMDIADAIAFALR
jgi:tetratricopeptide (TPR) repeat protein